MVKFDWSKSNTVLESLSNNSFIDLTSIKQENYFNFKKILNSNSVEDSYQ